MSSLVFDLRDVLRSLRREPAYGATVVLTLALTLGATTAVFSIVNGVLLEPLTFRDSNRLVAVREVWKEFAERFPVLPVNARHFEHWRTHATSFESMAQYLVLPANLTGAGDAAQVSVVHASGSLFEVLRVGASRGRTLSPDDERADRPRVAVITDSCWRQRLGADPAAVGRTIVLDGLPFTVAGILAPGFQLPGERRLTPLVDAVVPIRLDADAPGWVGDHNNEAIGRLRAGATLDQARAELNVLQAQVSDLAAREAHQPVTLAASLTPLADFVVGGARRGLLLLFGAIDAVLLIACSNIANLSLTRTLARRRDAAIRLALGASRGRLLTRLLVEHVALAVLGGAAGLLLARAAIAAFVRTAPIDLPRASEVTLDVPVLVFAAAVAVLAGVAVAIVPAWQLARGEAAGRLRVGGLATTDARGGLRARRLLLAAQVALSVALLVVTGLLTVSFARLLRSSPGFEARGTLALDVVLPLDRYAEAVQRAEVADRVLERVHAIPGVSAAAWSHILPLAGEGTVNWIGLEGDRRPWTVQPTANYRFVSAELFKALSIPLRHGRTFLDSDRERDTVPGVVTERTAARMWPRVDPIGQRFRWSPNASAKPVVVVGVVGDTKTRIDGDPPLMVYLPYWYQPRPRTSLVVHTGVEAASVAGAVRRAIRGVDPDIAIADAQPMEQLVDTALGSRRYQVWLFVTFGAMALIIAAVGVYAVTAYGVTRRRREMNIRVALGAPRSHALGLIVRQALAPVAAGLVCGTVVAAALGRAVAGLLYEVQPRDPLVLAGVTGLVGAIALAACLVAARRGLVIEPATALRDE